LYERQEDDEGDHSVSSLGGSSKKYQGEIPYQHNKPGLYQTYGTLLANSKLVVEKKADPSTLDASQKSGVERLLAAAEEKAKDEENAAAFEAVNAKKRRLQVCMYLCMCFWLRAQNACFDSIK